MSVAFSVKSDDDDIDGGVVTNGASGAIEAPGDSPAATPLGAELGSSPPREFQPKRALLLRNTEHHLPRPARARAPRAVLCGPTRPRFLLGHPSPAAPVGVSFGIHRASTSGRFSSPLYANRDLTNWAAMPAPCAYAAASLPMGSIN